MKHPTEKHFLRVAAGNAAAGPFGAASRTDLAGWVEGPSATKKIGGEHYIYFDHYGDPQYHGAIKSTDMKNWQDISAAVFFPKGIRHGTVLTVPAGVVHHIQNH